VFMWDRRVGAEEGEEEGEEAGERFSQKRVWLMWPPALKLRAVCRCNWERRLEEVRELETEVSVALRLTT